MPVPLLHQIGRIQLMQKTARQYSALVCAKTHRSTLRHDITLFVHQIDDAFVSIRVELA